MRLPIDLLVSILAVPVLSNLLLQREWYAPDFHLISAPLETGTRVIEEVYDNCKEYDAKSEVVNVGESCLWNAMEHMIQALSDIHGTIGVALLSNTVNSAQKIEESSSLSARNTVFQPLPTSHTDKTPLLKRHIEDAGFETSFLSYLDDKIPRQAEDRHRPRAVHVEHSEIHHRGGLAVRTDIRSDDATLYVHTNGSHSTAAFTKDRISPLNRRETISTPEYRFDGAQGLKLQLRVTDQQSYKTFDSHLWAVGHGLDGARPQLAKSDSWAFVLCRRSNNEPVLWGKLVAEDQGAGNEWESGNLLSC